MKHYCILALLTTITTAFGAPQPIPLTSATANSARAGKGPELAIDGKRGDDSRWIADGSTGWIEVRWDGVRAVAGVHFFSGFGAGDAVTAFRLRFWRDGAWQDIPSAVVSDNTATALALAFDGTVEVVTDRLRVDIEASPKNAIRVREIVVWPAGGANLPPLPVAAPAVTASVPSTPQEQIVPLYLNQSGFNLGKPKRFTAPTLADGTGFVVRAVEGGAPVFRGKIQGHIGDFTAFDPEDERDWVVEAGGLTSVPFRIGRWWIERVSYQDTIDFMIDSRHHVGNDRATCVGSFGWRDDHHFGWELHVLIPQLLSNPSAYEEMPRQITYEAPDERKLWGELEPYSDNAPDIVKLIHWGADIIVTQRLSHEHLKAQLAYFLYAWPLLKQWLPEQNYAAVRDYAFARWSDPVADHKYPYDRSADQNLLALKTKMGTTKGELPPGASVQPNLLMHEVALREGRPDADLYLEAARKQVEWMIQNLDWNDPITTKGQRMSEFLTVTGMAHFLQAHPENAPDGLAQKIEEWAKVVVLRSDNLWDFRKLGDAPDQWTPMGEKPQMWNEPGNVAGLPAIIFAALPAIQDPALRARLEQIAWAHIDQVFGRNPVGRHFSFDAPREVDGVEHGWFRFYPGGIGRLANARFVIDGSPKNAHYPWHPEKGDIGWTEGWIQHNLPFNLSLAYFARTDTRITVRREDATLHMEMTGPDIAADLNVPRTRAVQVRAGDDTETVILQSVPGERGLFRGKFSAKSNTPVEVTHGFGWMASRSNP